MWRRILAIALLPVLAAPAQAQLNVSSPTYTYRAAARAIASAATATDIFTISGNASNTVSVTKLSITCTQTTAGIIEILISKHSTADSGGTSSTVPAVPLDSTNPAASSSVLAYTANPTLGTAVGNVDTAKLGCMATGTATPNDIYIATFGQGGVQPVVLRGTAQQLAVNLNSVTVSGGSFDITVEWTEK